MLNDLNVEARWVKFQLVRDRVFVTVSVLARPFVPAHLHQAVQILSEIADGIDDELAAKLTGRTTFTDHDEAALRADLRGRVGPWTPSTSVPTTPRCRSRPGATRSRRPSAITRC